MDVQRKKFSPACTPACGFGASAGGAVAAAAAAAHETRTRAARNPRRSTGNGCTIS